MAEFFDYLKALYNKDKIEYDAVKFNPWMMLQFISHDKDHFIDVEAINKYLFIINPKYIWKYLRYKLPYNKNKFLKYVKKDTLNFNEDDITLLMHERGVSRYEAKQCLQSN